MRYAWIEQHRDDYAASRMCRLLEVSRTGYLQWRGRPPSARAQANARLDAEVAAMHAASRGSYGRPRIVRGLREQGVRVGPERVRRSLQRQALRPVYKRPYRVTTDSNHRKPVAPNILERRFDGWNLNRAWVADITYLQHGRGLALSGRGDGSGQPPDRRLVDERSPARRTGLPGAANGLLASQTGAGTDHAFRPRQPIRE